MNKHPLAIVVCLIVLAAFVSGCGGFKVPISWVLPNKAGDNRPDPADPDDGSSDPGDGDTDGDDDDDDDDGGGNGGGGNGGGGGGATDTRFSGTWIAAYGDDLPDGATQRQHVMQMTLIHSNSTINGNGQMVRFYNTGNSAYDANPTLITVRGTVTGDDAVLNIEGAQINPFVYEPQWYVRYGGNRLVGAYAEKNPNNGTLENGGRMGHGIWYRATSLVPTGDWVAAVADDSGSNAFPRRVRTGQLGLTQNNDVITGLGSFVEFGAAGGPETFTFDVTQGGSQLRRIEFTLGNFQPASGTEDWYTLQTSDVMVGAYSRFDDNADLQRFGHGLWRRSPAANSNDYVREWTAAFGDTQPSGDDGSDFLISMTNVALNGNTLTGSARVWDESESNPTFKTYTIENGSVVGTSLQMDLVSGARRFVWDMRIANGFLMGTYRRTGTNDAFQGFGRAEWQFGTRTGLEGTWAASFFDTYSARLDFDQVDDRASQLAVMTISDVDENGSIIGTGYLRLANESTRRNYTITGDVTADGIEITWSGADLFGQTLWQMQKAGGRLPGTYSNLDDQNAVEHQGHATFVRVN